LPEPSIYDYLAKLDVADLTIAQLNSATELTNLDPVNIEFWQGVITLNRVLSDSRTFPHGLVIPETGTVIAQEILDSANATYAPSGTEIWQVMNIDIKGCLCALRDGDGNMSQITADTFKAGTIYLTRTMSIFFNNATGGAVTPTVAYLKVAL